MAEGNEMGGAIIRLHRHMLRSNGRWGVFLIDGVLPVSLDCVWHLRCLLSTFTRLPDSACAQNRLCESGTASGPRSWSDESQPAVQGVLLTPRCALSPAFLSVEKPSWPIGNRWHDNAPCRPTCSIFFLCPSWSPPCLRVCVPPRVDRLRSIEG